MVDGGEADGTGDTHRHILVSPVTGPNVSKMYSPRDRKTTGVLKRLAEEPAIEPTSLADVCSAGTGIPRKGLMTRRDSSPGRPCSLAGGAAA